MLSFRAVFLAAGIATLATGATAGIYFQDNFDGSDLSPDWTVENPNPDNYLVEDGVLTLLVSDRTPPEYGKAINALVLNKPLPKGDWKITVRLQLTPQTLGEVFRAGIAKDKDNGLFTILALDTINYVDTNINLVGQKLSKGKATAFYRTLYTIKGRNLEGRASVFPQNIAAVDLQLEKRKRSYIARMRLLPAESGASSPPDGKWREVQKLTSLRAPGNKFVMSFGSWSSDYLPHDGEALIAVDSVTIETP